MKNAAKLTIVGCLLVFAIACNKLDNWWDHVHGGNAGKKLNLKELKHGNRVYRFFYDHAGFVDSIRATDPSNNYTYVVYHHGPRIDSASLIQGGSTVSTNGDIHYGPRGNITSFTYNLYAFPGFPPQTVTLTYDARGNIKTIGTETLHFNHDNDLVHWERSSLSAAYTYDNKLNPLYFIDDLFVMFVEERYIWEYAFSQHNSTNKTYDDGHLSFADENDYDAHQRLVKKKFTEGGSLPDSLEFSYSW